MPITYTEALNLLKAEASSIQSTLHQHGEIILLEDAIGRTPSTNMHSPHNTPEFSTSAMDGYVIHSDSTEEGQYEHTFTFEVWGTMAAGDIPLTVPKKALDVNAVGMQYTPCVEIMTGARFPELEGRSGYFNAVIPVERVVWKGEGYGTKREIIETNRFPVRDQHRRLAGGDFAVGDVVIAEGEIVGGRHVMALASLGISTINVRPASMRRLRIGIFSTGAELQAPPNSAQPSTTIPDINRPYILSTLRHLSPNITATFIASLPDSQPSITTAIQTATLSNQYDILISTGAVSAGKFDFIRPAIESIPKSRIIFHKVAMRPGHPVLFAMLGQPHSSSTEPRSHCQTAFFGLPGNPIAAAVCLKFIVEPYLENMGCVRSKPPVSARLSRGEEALTRTRIQPQTGPCESRLPGKDEFRHGVVTQDAATGHAVCRVSEDQSPAKAKPFLHANCFIHVPADFDERGPDAWLRCYPI